MTQIVKIAIAGCTLHEDLLNCDLYRKWFAKTTSKKNIISFASIDNIDYEREKNMKDCQDVASESEKKFVMQVIEDNLEPELLEAYFNFLDGIKIAKKLENRLLKRVGEISIKFNLREHIDG